MSCVREGAAVAFRLCYSALQAGDAISPSRHTTTVHRPGRMVAAAAAVAPTMMMVQVHSWAAVAGGGAGGGHRALSFGLR